MNKRAGLGLMIRLYLHLAVVFVSVGCSSEDVPEAAEKPKPAQAFDPMALAITDSDLMKGREIWIPKCGQCHISGLGGAPRIGDKVAWATRISKGKETLYDHAINGFVGPLYYEMPPKGGFTELTDDEVKLAVDFVVFASE